MLPATLLRCRTTPITATSGKIADFLVFDADPLADIRNTTRLVGELGAEDILGLRLSLQDWDEIRTERELVALVVLTTFSAS